MASHKVPGAVLVLALLTACDEPPTGPEEQPILGIVEPQYSHGTFATSNGIYRVPYVDGSDVTVSNDHHDHNPVNRIDMSEANAGTFIVAAASGTIRGIVDWHGNSPGAGDGLAADSSGPQLNGGDDSLEHSCQDTDDMDGDPIPGSVVVGLCQQYNNYVWIEHPNGEWTKYTHFGTGTVTARGWQVGDWIVVGDTIGIEGDVGRASGRHLHFEVGLPDDPAALTPFSRLGGFMVSSFGVNLVPRVCDADNVDYLYESGESYVPNPCDHDPPTADAGGPYEVDEGATLQLDATGSSDPEGRPLSYAWTPSGMLDDSTLAQPTFDTSDDGVTNLTLAVFDQVEALSDTDGATVTVNNVAPTVTIDAAQETEIDEGTSVLVKASFSDPGVSDTHTAEITCRDVTGYEQVLTPAVQVTSTAGPLEGTVAAYCSYGDTSESGNPASGTFEVTVKVTDDDGGVGEASFDLTVHNTAPDPEISIAGATNVNGVPTFIAMEGESVDFSVDVEDDGSDDLTLTWDWDDGSTDPASYLLNPPGTDPFPSPNESPRDVTDEQSHAWAGACFYEISLTAVDDDGGQGIATANVIIAGTSGQARGVGFWMPQYRNKRSNAFSAETLTCYLAIAGQLSEVFDEERSGTGSFEEAADVLRTNGSKGDLVEELDQQLLAVWLNFANGAFSWTDLVDTTGDGVPDTAFDTAIQAAEDVRLDAGATAEEIEAQKDVLEAINLMHGG